MKECEDMSEESEGYVELSQGVFICIYVGSRAVTKISKYYDHERAPVTLPSC